MRQDMGIVMATQVGSGAHVVFTVKARIRKAPGRAGAFVVLGIAAGVTPAR